MKALVLGAGVIGVTTAYFLGTRGYEVEVIERQPEPGRETSFANGGQLSYSHAEPWANPSVLKKVFKWMFRADAPLVLRPRLDLDMMSWGLKFLMNCSAERTQVNSVSLLRLGLYSKKVMEQLRVYTGIEFNNIREGILHIYSDPQEFEHASLQAKFQEKFSCPMEICDLERCLTLEPALGHTERKLVGGIHQPFDESGDVFTFTQKLAALCTKEHKTVFHYNKHVTRLASENGRITSLITNRGEYTADVYVVALGSYSPIFLKPLGIHAPIYPMKGYSITLPADMNQAPMMSLTDSELKIVYSRIGKHLRVAGTAEFAGYNTDIRPVRVRPILEGAKALFPQCGFSEPSSSWACLRPSTPDGPPIIGKTKYENLYLNTGHGTLGWTQAAGSAHLIADVIENKPTEISLEGFDLERY